MKIWNIKSLKTKSWDKDNKAQYIKEMVLYLSGSKNVLPKTRGSQSWIKKEGLLSIELDHWMNNLFKDQINQRIPVSRSIMLRPISQSLKVWFTHWTLKSMDMRNRMRSLLRIKKQSWHKTVASTIKLMNKQLIYKVLKPNIIAWKLMREERILILKQ